MIPLIAGLTILEIVFFSIFFLALIVATAFDRDYRGEPAKWIIAFIAIVLVAIYTWPTWTFSTIFAYVTSFQLWLHVMAYLGIGLGYSVIEFVFAVRRSARWYKRQFQSWAAGNAVMGRDESTYLDKFIDRHTNSGRLISPVNDGGQLSGKINRASLVQSIIVWTIYWPAYLISLIFDNLIKEIAHFVADIFIKFGSGFVRYTFNNVMK